MLATISYRSYIRALEQEGATSQETARRLGDLGYPDTWIFRRMVDKGVFVVGEEDQYYLNPESGKEFLIHERKILLVGGGIAIMLFLIFAIWMLVRYLEI
jgi:hypothetical protein